MSIEQSSHAEVERLIAGVPEQLQAYPQFVVWSPVERNGRITKPPINPLTGQFADSTNPETWTSFNQALRAFSTGRYAGLGFVFTEDDPFTGVDLDHVLDASKMVAPWASEIVTALDSYTEISPSSTGLHIIVQAALPEGGRRKEQIEMYDRGRYFTLTATPLQGSPDAILARQSEVMRLYDSLSTKAVAMRPRAEYSLVRGDEEVLEKAKGAKNGSSFSQLWRGDTAGFPSHSEARFTLLLRLGYWTQYDSSQMERLFKQSALYTEKSEQQINGMTRLQYDIQQALRKRRY